MKVDTKTLGVKRVFLWALVGAYTIALPYANLVYNTISIHFSSVLVGKVPITIISLFGIAYVVSCLFTNKGIRHLALFIPCAVIVYVVITLEPETNKHIHIPQYVLMSWLLFEAFSIDYKGRGIFIIIFICSSMLGVVDEIQQGIYPERYYGVSDMLVNSVSSIIGIITLMGLRKRPVGNWDWVNHLMTFKRSVRLVLFGAVGATFTCIYLYLCKLSMAFWKVYPAWLFGWNCIFLVLGIVALVFHFRCLGEYNRRIDEKHSCQYNSDDTPRLWVLPTLVILVIVHGLVVLTGVSGWRFD